MLLLGKLPVFYCSITYDVVCTFTTLCDFVQGMILGSPGRPAPDGLMPGIQSIWFLCPWSSQEASHARGMMHYPCNDGLLYSLTPSSENQQEPDFTFVAGKLK